jgi:hypothetical protein
MSLGANSSMISLGLWGNRFTAIQACFLRKWQQRLAVAIPMGMREFAGPVQLFISFLVSGKYVFLKQPWRQGSPMEVV